MEMFFWHQSLGGIGGHGVRICLPVQLSMSLCTARQAAVLAHKDNIQCYTRLFCFLVRFIARSEDAIAIAIAIAAGCIARSLFSFEVTSKGDNSAINWPETLRLRSSCDKNEKWLVLQKFLRSSICDRRCDNPEGQILKKFRIWALDRNFQAILKRMTFSRDWKFNQTPILWGIFKVTIENFKRDWSFQARFFRLKFSNVQVGVCPPVL